MATYRSGHPSLASTSLYGISVIGDEGKVAEVAEATGIGGAVRRAEEPDGAASDDHGRESHVR